MAPQPELRVDQGSRRKACRVCGAAACHPVFRAKEMMYGTREEFEYFQCEDCGCLQISAIPDNLGSYYRSDYYSLRSNHAAAYRNSLKNWLNRLRDQITLFAPGGGGFPLRVAVPSIRAAYAAIGRTPRLRLGSRIVDVGCGGGELLYRLHNAGFSNLLGIDPFMASDKSVDKSLRFMRCDLTELHGEFDLIMMHHSFEHVTSPAEVFSKLQVLLAPDGVALIRIPVADSFAWEHYRTSWFQLDAPRHLYLHTRKSMGLLAQLHGLRVLQTYCDSDENQFLISEKYQLDIPMILPPDFAGTRFYASPEQLESYRARSRELNRLQQGDQAVFFLAKDAGKA